MTKAQGLIFGGMLVLVLLLMGEASTRLFSSTDWEVNITFQPDRATRYIPRPGAWIFGKGAT